MLTNLLIGVLSGVIASSCFFVSLAILRPRLEISKQITKTPTDDGNPEHRFRIKIVNKSRRAAVDVEISAFTVRPRKVPEGNGHGEVFVSKKINLRRDHRSVFPGYRRKDQRASYAQRIRFDEEAVRMLTDPNQQHEILIRVTARDGISGWPRVFEHRYALANSVVDGTFENGRSLKVVNWTPPSRTTS